MSARLIVHGWAIERAATLREAGAKADLAYTKGPMAEACHVYAAGLRRAATDLEETAMVILSLPSESADRG